MAKLSAHGKEVGRFFSMQSRTLKAIMEDGKILRRGPYTNGWKISGKIKSHHATAQAAYESLREKYIAAGLAWALEVKSLPSVRTLEEWSNDGGCETPTGHWTEPDGTGPDGVPSWLRVLGMI